MFQVRFSSIVTVRRTKVEYARIWAVNESRRCKSHFVPAAMVSDSCCMKSHIKLLDLFSDFKFPGIPDSSSYQTGASLRNTGPFLFVLMLLVVLQRTKTNRFPMSRAPGRIRQGRYV